MTLRFMLATQRQWKGQTYACKTYTCEPVLTVAGTGNQDVLRGLILSLPGYWFYLTLWHLYLTLKTACVVLKWSWYSNRASQQTWRTFSIRLKFYRYRVQVVPSFQKRPNQRALQRDVVVGWDSNLLADAVASNPALTAGWSICMSIL